MPETSTGVFRSDSSIMAYRLVKKRVLDDPLSTEGARRYGGRWNPPGVGILYTSASPELALLEQLVHLPTLAYADLPQLFLLTLALPERPRPLLDLPTNWREEAGFGANHQQLAGWLLNPDVLALGVPSAVMPASFNYLLHPQHPAYAQVAVVGTSPLAIDPRLWQNKPPY